MTIGNHAFGLGALIALLVLVVNLILWITGHPADDNVVYGDACALAIAYLVP